jgi:general secretion pathway protein G
MKAWAQQAYKKGFTIVELLIVIVVIGVLAAIVIVSYLTVQGGAYDTSVKSDLTHMADTIHLKALDDDAIPAGGATSSLTGDSLQFDGIEVNPDEDAYDPSVANLYYCAGKIDGEDEFGLIARSLSGKVFRYLSQGGLAEYTGNLVWTASPELDACEALGFSDPFTWSYGYNPDQEILWADWTQPENVDES